MGDFGDAFDYIFHARESQAGFPHPLDVPWQHEFESAFIYQETPDQLTAIADVKRVYRSEPAASAEVADHGDE